MVQSYALIYPTLSLSYFLHFQVTGLIDSADWDDLKSRISATYRKWRDDLLDSNAFTTYFKTYILEDFQSGMLADATSRAGLGHSMFYSNPVESIHFKYKNRILQKLADNECSGKPKKKCAWTKGAEIYISLVQEHIRNLERALIGEGIFSAPF